MTEKQASSEIAQSRERFETDAVHRGYVITRRTDGSYNQGDTAHAYSIWQASERSTLERLALELKEVSGEIGSDVAYHIEAMYPGAVKATPKSFLLSVRNFTSNKISALAERIRGKE